MIFARSCEFVININNFALINEFGEKKLCVGVVFTTIYLKVPRDVNKNKHIEKELISGYRTTIM